MKRMIAKINSAGKRAKAVPFPFSGKTSKRVTSVLLCVCMAACLLCNLGGGAAASNDGFTQKIVPDSRMSDDNTMESYVNKLLSSDDGSRYAGRVWTDKSVFAHNGSTDGTISLENKNDGYDGTVNFDSDFGTVFSAISSSQRIDEYSTSPVDVLFLLDMSGSMAEDVQDGASHSDYNTADPEKSKRITHSRIYKVLKSINNSIQKLMDMGDDNRVAVVGYGATAYTLLELGHYKPATTGKYLEVKLFRTYSSVSGNGNTAPNTKDSATYMVGTVDGLQKQDKEDGEFKSYARYARNDYRGQKFYCDPKDTVNIGFSTNMQAGIYQGFEELYKNYNSIEDVRKIYESEETGKKTAVQRVPIAIVMTDGGSNYALKRNSSSSALGDEWYKVPIYTDPYITSYSGNQTKYRTESLEGAVYPDPSTGKTGKPTYERGGDVTIFDILLTASYEKSKMQNKYTKLVQQAREDKEYPLPIDNEKNFSIYTLSVDTPNVDWQTPRVYSTLDPKHFFNKTLQEHEGKNPNTWTQKNDIIKAYQLFEKWQEADSQISSSFTDSTTPRTVKFNQPPESDEVTKDDVIKNINYNNSFADIEAADIDKTFDDMLDKIRGIAGSAFTPFSGYNDAGVKNSITYKDPLGEYMELKNGSITVNGAVTANGAASANNTAFDMSMLLYGEMRGMVRAGVYDYHWNTEYISKHENEKVEGNNDPFPLGWYKGEDPETAYKAEKTTEGDSGSWPTEDPKTGTTYANAEAAWADGWVMRFDFNTLLDFVPIANAKEDGSTINPDDLDESIKNTVYTCYRFADTQQERNKLRCNPIFGDVPEELQIEWNKKHEDTGSYPTDSDMYSSYPGVYRLSDIRVWEEHTGDFIDQTGSITPEDQSGYDDLLYVNLPVSATPIQLAEIALGKDGPISYKDNLSDKKQSTPFRLFYAVGLTEDLIIRDGGTQTGVDVSKISGEYISTHSDPDSGNISFISNWYSNTVYHGYAGDDDGSTRGDAGVSFSPDAENRYYLFQKPLPLSAHAYRVLNDSGDVAPVDKADGTEWSANGAGNGSTTWETVGDAAQSAASWVGGEFIGTYNSDTSFKEALEKNITTKDDVRYITDDKGKVYPLPATLTGAIITYTGDQLSDVDANANGEGYADGAKSFSSDDYFFLCIEYYMPIKDTTGKDIYGNDDAGTQAVRKVYRMIARKGSAFGSGLPSENINNGDMLCWTDINHKYKLEIEYNSRTDTGDITRGRPTLEKLTLSGDDLRTYLKEQCKLDDTKNIEIKDPTTGEVKNKTYLDLDVAYWASVQADPHMAELIKEITDESEENRQAKFNELFDWSVAAKTGGIRVGDMHNNVQAKGDNATETASNYYVPTLSETSTAGSGLVINNYLGNNGRMEIANANLIVTKTLAAPDGFKLTKEQEENEEFEYQVFEGEMAGERLAQRLKWNPFSQSWQKRIESLDILTDNSSLLLDTNGKRALFCCKDGQPPEQVVEVINGDEIKYCYADKSGEETEIECNEAPEKLYYMYLPSNNSGDSNLTYHLFGSRYEGGDGYDGTTEQIEGAGTTVYCPAGTDTDGMGDNENQHFATATGELTAGSREYWTTKAELIPYQKVYAAENPSESVEGNTESIRWDHATDTTSGDYILLDEFTLVTVIPDTSGVESKVYSPYSSRTQYMTVPLYFGYKSTLAKHLKDANETFATCQHTGEHKLTTDDLYDQTAENTETTAEHTANFTLKSGEGLLLTGLGDKADYRFTEKLTDTQRSQGYVLQSVKQVTQSGDKSVPLPNPDNGVYSVSGDTDSSTTEQTHYTNTFEPELFVLTKSMVDKSDAPVNVAPNEEFTFTLTFKPTDEANMTDMDGTLYYWKGNKNDYTSALEWTDGDTEYQMPQNAPPLSNYKDYLTSEADGKRLATITPVEGKYTINLKANEAIVFYGLIAGTNFTVTETENAKYPVVPDGSYTQTGTISRADENPDASDPAKTPNRANFTNRLQSGILTVEKRIKNTDPDSTQEFKFNVSLSGAELKQENLNPVKYNADGTAYSSSEFTLNWDVAEGGSLQANVTLRHGEKLMIEGIPLNTEYTVTETDKGDYNLQHVANNTDDKASNAEGNYLTLTGDGVSGEINNSDSQAYLLFVNEKTASMPFAGGIGFDGIIITGILLIGLATVLAGLQMRRNRRKRRNARIGGVRK